MVFVYILVLLPPTGLGVFCNYLFFFYVTGLIYVTYPGSLVETQTGSEPQKTMKFLEMFYRELKVPGPSG